MWVCGQPQPKLVVDVVFIHFKSLQHLLEVL
jgi:hypothetical protein